jgi:hypothetical protein
VSIVVFDSSVRPYHGRALYAVGTACELAGDDLERGLQVYPGSSDRGATALTRDDVTGSSSYRLYRASATDLWVLCPHEPGQSCPLHGLATDHRARIQYEFRRQADRPKTQHQDGGVTMSEAGRRGLRVLDGSYVLDRPADVSQISLRADVLAVVLGPDGSTVMRRDDTGDDAWSALWNGDEAHDVQATGMLSAIVAPLAANGLPVWVVSSYDGDLVFVPTDQLEEACEVLQAAGHRIRR